MTIETKKRQKILRRIYNIPEERLNELEEFLAKIELQTQKEQNNLSFAGSWHNIDNSVFQNLTEDLIKNRSRNSRRKNE